MEVLWFIPTHGDSRYLGTTKGGRLADFSYFRQVAQAADSLGYAGVLIQTGRSCEDPWTLSFFTSGCNRKIEIFNCCARPGVLSAQGCCRSSKNGFNG